ncbi:hypothetical protein [Paenibacillus alvei]|uniref:hypothetical protein n=1 Tax=Paenibacillus alvei TaxID=44250 RepID=UPI002281CB07|nr:hypothetical protein [Paenibacillus alvei]
MEDKLNFCSACGHDINQLPAAEPTKIVQTATAITTAEPSKEKRTTTATTVKMKDKSSSEKVQPTAFIAGFKGILLAFIIALGFLFLGDIYFYSFTLWFILPVGGMVFGMLTTSFYYGRIVKKGFKPSRKNFPAAMVMTIISFALIQYGEYQITYVNEDNTINHHFKGEHISNYMDENGDLLTFSNYFVYKLKNSSTSVRVRGGEIGEFDSQMSYNAFRSALTLVGFIVGGLTTGLLLTQGTTHCSACKRAYVEEHKLGEIGALTAADLQDELIRAIKLNNFSHFINLVQKGDYQNSTDSYNHDNTYIVKVGLCPNCDFGFVILRNYYRKASGEFEEDEHKKVVYPTSNSFVNAALNHLETA